MRSPRAYRRNALWVAAMVHRVSGIALAAFLPFHFLALGLSLKSDNFESFLRWTDGPLVKFAEGGLIFMLAVHFLGGLRILLVENFSWRANQLRVATAAGGVAAMVAFAFLLRVL